MFELSESTLDVFKTSGSNLYFIDDLVFVDEAYYSKFYRIEDAYDYYKDMQKVFNKNIIFIYKDNTYTINENTTLDEVKEAYNKDNVVEDKSDNINIREIYIKNLKKKDCSLYRLFYKKENKKVKMLKK